MRISTRGNRSDILTKHVVRDVLECLSSGFCLFNGEWAGIAVSAGSSRLMSRISREV